MSASRAGFLASMLVFAPGAGAGGGAADPAIHSVEVTPARVRPGDAVTVRTVYGHGRHEPGRYALGLSIRDAEGVWHDVPSVWVRLGPGGRASLERRWRVPAADAPAPGPLTVVVALWDRRPESEGAVRLDSRRVDGAALLLVSEAPAPPGDLGGWRTRSQRLGRGRLDPANARLRDGTFDLRLPAGTREGAQVLSSGRHGHGRYRAVLQTPRAPGSLSAFFLYEDQRGDRNDEIDIEILNDESRRILFSVWVDGEQVEAEERTLPFDPAAGPHEYGIDYGPDEIGFRVDGQLVHVWRGAIPDREMRVMANVWWPHWLQGPRPPQDAVLRFRPVEPLERAGGAEGVKSGG